MREVTLMTRDVACLQHERQTLEDQITGLHTKHTNVTVSAAQVGMISPDLSSVCSRADNNSHRRFPICLSEIKPWYLLPQSFARTQVCDSWVIFVPTKDD